MARVRTLLYTLRPDQADPLRPQPPPVTSAPSVRVRDPRDGWGGTPPGIDLPEVVADPSVAQVVAVLDRIRSLPPDAAALSRWLRAHAVLETLRGLYVDVGQAFAGAEQLARWARDLTARRDGAHHHGRTLVLAVCVAWGIPGA